MVQRYWFYDDDDYGGGGDGSGCNHYHLYHHYHDGDSGHIVVVVVVVVGSSGSNRLDESKVQIIKDGQNCLMQCLQNLLCTHSGLSMYPCATILIGQPHQMSIISLWLQLWPPYWTFTDAPCLSLQNTFLASIKETATHACTDCPSFIIE